MLRLAGRRADDARECPDRAAISRKNRVDLRSGVRVGEERAGRAVHHENESTTLRRSVRLSDQPSGLLEARQSEAPTTLIGAVRVDGSTACMAIEGATDTEVFHAYVRDVLGPTLRPGDLVIMDNLSPHKSEPTLGLIAQAGAEVDTEDLFAAIYPYEIEALNDARRGLPGSAADLAVAIGEFHKAACRTIFANAKGLSV